ncbi:Chitin-binding type-1 domain-containing protein [Abeliophyllum distichum]|uniref:Chitin-binding type-1 domain-containing protein n=1 Tax=Abeliophyllum distichum TaxID=126358 RepID=A0ABD1RXV8_9LAMI
MENAGNIPQNTNSNTPPISNASNMVPPMLGSNQSSPFGVNLTQTPSVKLDKNNFLLWQNMILPIIRGHNLEGHILGTKVCPPEFVGTQIIGEAGTNVEMIPNPQYTQWMSTDQLLIG